MSGAKKATRYFPDREYELRRERVRAAMAERGLDACLIAAPENIYYLTGLDHMGYFAYELLILPMEGEPVLITRAMERRTVEDQVPDVRHVGYSDGQAPPPRPADEKADLVLATRSDEGDTTGLEPWSMSFGIPTRDPAEAEIPAPVAETVRAVHDAGLHAGRLGIERASSFLSHKVAQDVIEGLPEANWSDCSGLVDDCRLVQSPAELELTRQAATVSHAMMLAAIAAAGVGMHKRDVMAAIYDAMFRRGGTYPGFVPLVRSTRTLEHEHGTWAVDDRPLRQGDVLFLEMAGCIRHYHAPTGRLVFIGDAPRNAYRVQPTCERAIEAAAARIGPGVPAAEVYRAWQAVLDEAGLAGYRRHHCGYSVGIGFPPSWSGSGVPVGLREHSDMVLRPGMVFHLMSWLLRTGKGDSFLSDTVVVTEDGCEVLTTVDRDVLVRR